MARQTIGTGTTADDGTGDTLRAAGNKINANFRELYTQLGDSVSILGLTQIENHYIVFNGALADSHNTHLVPTEPTARRDVYIPDASGTILLDSATATLTNKTLTSPVINNAVLDTPQINDTTDSFQYVFQPNNLAKDININLPLLADSDAFVFEAHLQTLINKTLTSPQIGTKISDVNGAELVNLTATGSAVNEITIANAATGGLPTIAASGDDPNVTLAINSKGTGSVRLSKPAYNGVEMTANGAASASHGMIVGNKSGALSVSLADGTIAGEIKVFVNKGTGVMTVTPANFAQGTSFALAQYDGCTVIWEGANWYLTGNQSTITI